MCKYVSIATAGDVVKQLEEEEHRIIVASA